MMATRSGAATVNGIYNELARAAFRNAAGATPFSVAADVCENDHEFAFHFDVPGLKADDLDITLTNRVLAVRGARRLESGENEKVRRGRPQGAFAVSYSLPETIDGERMTADLADGVLTVRVPKHPKAQPRRIPIGRDPGPTGSFG